MDERRVVAEVHRLTLRELRLWVDEGWVRPAKKADGPVFDEIDLARIRLLCDLKKEMGLSSDAMPVVLGLIDRLNETRRHLRHLMNALEAQPAEVRQDIMATFRSLKHIEGTLEDDQ
ncbi:MerR family transcriptional regulator [Lutimaribacter saemankumensis]|nr:MerR family transcriptional regulator [Lutimaribacter saemankumensis]